MTLPPQARPAADPASGRSQAHRKPSRLRAALKALQPETPTEMTLFSGLGLVSAGFMLAQLINSLLFMPLSLLVPGAVLTVIAITARPETQE